MQNPHPSPPLKGEGTVRCFRRPRGRSPICLKSRLPLHTPDVLTIKDLKAYYINEHFGTRREVRAVDGISLTVRRNEVYGIAGESSSGKTSLIKTLAGAIRPPMRVIDGSVKFDFGGKHIDVYAEPAKMKAARWQNLSYIMQGSMSVLNPVRRIKHAFNNFAYRHMGLDPAAFRQRVEIPPAAPGP